jgi:hypothetical protein
MKKDTVKKFIVEKPVSAVLKMLSKKGLSQRERIKLYNESNSKGCNC